MKTQYIDMPISLQIKLAHLHRLVGGVLFRGEKYVRIAPVEFVFELPQGEGYEVELIVDKRIRFSPHVNVHLIPMTFKFRQMEEIIENLGLLNAQNYLYREEDAHRHEWNCLNFEDGVGNLFKGLYHKYIFICKAPVRQVGSNRLIHYDLHVFVWCSMRTQFLHLCAIRRNEGDKLIPGPDWQKYLNLFDCKEKEELSSE